MNYIQKLLNYGNNLRSTLYSNIIFSMENQNPKNEEQWIADKDQKTEADQILRLPETPAELHQKQKQEEAQFIQKGQQIQKVLPKMDEKQVETNKFRQTVCLQDSNIFLITFIGRKMEMQGRIKATNYAIYFFVSHKKQEEEVYFEIPIGYLSRCELSYEDKVFSVIQIWLKYGCSFKIRYGENRADISHKSYKVISKLIDTSNQFPFEYGSSVDTHLKYVPFESIVPKFDDSYWYDNDGWKKYPSYPEKFKVPFPYLSKNNPEQRLVTLSFVFNNGKDNIGIWRTGVGKPDPAEDEWVGKSKFSSNLYTLQIKNKGIGTSKSSASRAVEVQGLQFIKDSFSNIFRITHHNHQSLKWLSNFNQTRWLDQIAFLLQEASALVNKIVEESAQITIIADTELRGAQLVALTQILLFPQCRTVQGFGRLMERQLLQWGCRFTKKQGDLQKGAGIIQFLDAVFQLTCIYPLSFEFSQAFLVFLAENVYSNKFGNFLLVTRSIKQTQRQNLNICCCIWAAVKEWLQDPEVACNYLNPFYVDFKECDIYELKQSLSVKHLKVWNGFFFKKFRQTNPDYSIFSRYQKLYVEHFHNKRKTEELRKELGQQHKIIVESKARLKELKSLNYL